MTWVVIGDMLLDIDNPARSVDVKAIQNNITALANGDSGAPPIQLAALDSAIKILGVPVAGTTYIQKTGAVTKIINGYVSSNSYFTAMVSGVVTVAYRVTTGAAGSPPTTQENAVNVTEVTEFAESQISSTFVNKGVTNFDGTVDITIVKGRTYGVDLQESIMDGVPLGITGTAAIKTGNDVVCIA